MVLKFDDKKEAVAFGEKANGNEIKIIKLLKKDQLERLSEMRSIGAFDEAIKAACQADLCNDALMAAGMEI